MNGAPAQPRLHEATPADAEDVARLLDVLGYACTAAEAVQRIITSADDPDQSLILASRNGSAEGLLALDFMYYLPLGRSLCRIVALVVDPQAQRGGLGRSLLREAERRAVAAGCAQLELTSNARRTEAHAFYRACGYEQTSLRFVRSL